MDDSAIACDEVIESNNKETKTISTKFNENKAICEVQNLYTLLAFLLITIALLIAISIYHYLIKDQAIQKTFLTILRHFLLSYHYMLLYINQINQKRALKSKI